MKLKTIFAMTAAALLCGCGVQSDDSGDPEVKAAATEAPETAEPGTTGEDRRVFDVRGVVQEVQPEESRVVVNHEEIPNYMPAMTMPFPVKDTNELADLAAGDQIRFKMIVTEDDGWIEDIQKTGSTNATAAAQPGERPRFRLVRDVEPLEVGDEMPNYVFTNSLGNKIELKDYAGQAYAFSFIFTRCPFPTFCPRMNNNFAEVYKQLTSMPNAPTNWHLFTISFDTQFDTPEQLRRYSQKYHPDPEYWEFLTGAQIDIDAITEQFGLAFAYREGTFDHNLRTVVVDANGKVQRVFIGNSWKPEELVQELIKGAKAADAGA